VLAIGLFPVVGTIETHALNGDDTGSIQLPDDRK